MDELLPKNLLKRLLLFFDTMIQNLKIEYDTDK